jgi:hypothetical protein
MEIGLFRWAAAAGAVQGRLLDTDDRIILGLCILCKPIHVFLRDGHIGIDGFDWALRETRITIYTRVGVDQKAVRRLVKCLHRAHRRAVRILTINAGSRNDVGHPRSRAARPS